MREAISELTQGISNFFENDTIPIANPENFFENDTIPIASSVNFFERDKIPIAIPRIFRGIHNFSIC
jgi:hypothetical protein